jgi:hypothetical protein
MCIFLIWEAGNEIDAAGNGKLKIEMDGESIGVGRQDVLDIFLVRIEVTISKRIHIHFFSDSVRDDVLFGVGV